MIFAQNLTILQKTGDWLTNSDCLHNLYRNLSDELSINKIWINNYEYLKYFPISHDSCTEFDYFSPNYQNF